MDHTNLKNDVDRFVSAGNVKDIVNRLVREVHFLRSSVETLKRSKEQDQQIIFSLRDEVKEYSKQIIQLSCENKLLTAEVDANKKFTTVLERTQFAIDEENRKLKMDFDYLSEDNRRLAAVVRDIHAQSYSNQATINEMSKFVNYIKLLEKQLVGFKCTSKNLAQSDEKLRKHHIIIANLLDSISKRGFPVSMPADYILGRNQDNLGDGVDSPSPLDCRLQMLVSTVHDLFASLSHSQEMNTMLRNTLRLYEDSTAFVDHLPIHTSSDSADKGFVQQ